MSKTIAQFLVFSAIIFYGPATVCAADSAVSDFYKQSTITFVVGTSAGGGYDLYGRTLMKFMPKHIPGNPRVIVQNMPGAGGTVAANYVANVAPRDGTTMAMCSSGFVLQQALRPEKVKYDTRALGWVGTISTMTDILAVFKTSGVKTIDDAKQKAVPIGGAGRYGTLSMQPMLVNALLGTKFKIVSGYKSGNEVNLAMDRGEVQGRTNQWVSWNSQRPEWVKQNKLNYLLQIGPALPELKGVPAFSDLVKTPEAKAMVDLLQVIQYVGRSVYMPPKVPELRLKALRQAFDETMKDSSFITRMEELKLEMRHRSGGELQADIERIMGGANKAAQDLKKTLGLK